TCRDRLSVCQARLRDRQGVRPHVHTQADRTQVEPSAAHQARRRRNRPPGRARLQQSPALPRATAPARAGPALAGLKCSSHRLTSEGDRMSELSEPTASQGPLSQANARANSAEAAETVTEVSVTETKATVKQMMVAPESPPISPFPSATAVQLALSA